MLGWDTVRRPDRSVPAWQKSVEMKTQYQRWRMLIIAIALITGYVLFGPESARELQFLTRDSPIGFRELVLDERTSISRGSILTTNLNHRSGASGDQSPRSQQDICEKLFQDLNSPATEDEGATVTIVEFFDYRCPYCKTLVEILRELKNEYSLRIIYKEWPTLGESSELAARAALAADKQGRYQETHTKLMGSGFIPSMGYIEHLTKELGMDLTQLSGDMASDETTLALRRTSDLAKEFGFFGTPSLVVGHTVVQGAVTRATLERLILLESSSELSSPC